MVIDGGGTAGVHAGAGDYRVTAYALEPAGIVWEVVCTLADKE